MVECAEGGGEGWAGLCTLEKGPLGGLSCTRCTMLLTGVLLGGQPRGFRTLSLCLASGNYLFNSHRARGGGGRSATDSP